MRGTWSKAALVALVGVVASMGCGGPMEEEASIEEQDTLVQEDVTEDVEALEKDHSSCKNVKVSPKVLWPPNHKFRLVTLSGASGITITSVKQDEPVNGTGDGNTSPDAMRADKKSAVYLRAERSGRGDGRVYCISFKARDSSGRTCTGTVTVGVPHDMGRGSTPINSGCRYDSFGY